MEYIKIKKQKNIYLDKIKKNFCFIENELLTKKEFLKIQNNTTKNLNNLIDYDFITINKNKTFWFFGCRQQITA